MIQNRLPETLKSWLTQNSTQPEWIGVRFVSEKISERVYRDQHPETIQQSSSKGMMVEVLVDGIFGYAATPRTDLAGMSQAIAAATLQARKAAPHRVFRFSIDQRPPTQAHYETPVRQRLQINDREIGELFKQVCARLKKSDKIVETQAFLQTTEVETILVSSNGAHSTQKLHLVSHDFAATGQDGAVNQRRTSGGMRGRSYQGGVEFFQTPDFWQRVDQVGDQALELLSAPECPTGTMDLVLMPDQMMLQIHESIGHPLELDRILGDERNYAGWSFVQAEDFGKLQYGSSLMNVTFDPTVPHEFASYAFDDTGNPAKREFLIEKGILKRGLGSLESQARSGLLGVANSRASLWNRPPIDRMANLNLEPGSSTEADILSGIERGILMESNRSWSIDDFRNKFQFGCEYARLIENGKLTHVVRNPNYRGITVPFWNRLKKVGNRETLGVFGTPNCGKGEPNQSIRVGHASPLCLFEGIEVFGGAS